MGLETDPQFVDALNSAWPTDTEDVAEGDDHIRNVKQALQGSLAGNASRAALMVAGQEVFQASLGAISSQAAGATQHLLALRNSVGGVSIGVRSDGYLVMYSLDAAGVIVDEFARAQPGGGWVLSVNGDDTLLVDPNDVIARAAGGEDVAFTLRSNTDQGGLLYDASENDVILRGLSSSGDVRIQRNGTDNVIVGASNLTRVNGPGDVNSLSIDAAGDATFTHGLAVDDAPAGNTDVVRKLELDALAARVATLEARWSGNDLTAGNITQNGNAVIDTSDLATEIAAGIAELATSAEVIAGTDDQRILTSAAMAANSDLVGDGYYILPGLAMFTFGKKVNTQTGNIAVTFPRAYAAGEVPKVIVSQGASDNSSSSTPIGLIDDSVTNTGFEVRVPGDVNNNWRSFDWVAIGKD